MWILVLPNATKCGIVIYAYGEIAQLARASGSYPAGRWFESTSRYQKDTRGTSG